MRKSEITKELIELSKKAKELDFPQDVEEGDWIAWDDGTGNVSIHLIRIPNKMGDGEFLILSFSRSLEFFQARHWWLKECGNYWSEDESGHWRYVIEAKKEQSFQAVRCNAYTHHEAIAKCCVKILEEK